MTIREKVLGLMSAHQILLNTKTTDYGVDTLYQVILEYRPSHEEFIEYGKREHTVQLSMLQNCYKGKKVPKTQMKSLRTPEQIASDMYEVYRKGL